MTKAQVIARLTAAAGNPVIVMYDEEEFIYGGAEGHWMLLNDDGIYEVRINSNGIGVPTYDQNINPIIVTFIEYDRVVDIRVYTNKENLSNVLPITTTMIYGGQTLAEVKEEILKNPVFSTFSARGYSSQNDNNSVYGESKGINIDLTGGTGVVNNFGN